MSTCTNKPLSVHLDQTSTVCDVLQNDSILYTASGDQHVGVWDTTAGRLLYYCAGHLGSVKAVCPHSVQPDMFASGRDTSYNQHSLCGSISVACTAAPGNPGKHGSSCIITQITCAKCCYASMCQVLVMVVSYCGICAAPADGQQPSAACSCHL